MLIFRVDIESYDAPYFSRPERRSSRLDFDIRACYCVRGPRVVSARSANFALGKRTILLAWMGRNLYNVGQVRPV